MDPTTTALGTWSGGRFMHFGEPVEEERLKALLRPGGGIDTVITADVYGEGAADRLLGEATRGLDRNSYCLVGAIGHDFYTGEREGAKGFPRFTDPRLRGEGEYAAYIRMATERSLERIGAERFDLLLLHNPDRTGYTSAAVWDGMRAVREAGLTRLLGVAPGPANGFTLDVIDCIERFGEAIDWAMVIFGPLEPWPGKLVLDAAAAHDVSLIARVVDYGGLFHDDVLPGHAFAAYDHRKFRPDGWVEAGRETLEWMRPYAARHGLTMLQLACQWTLAHPPVRCVAPTLIQEAAVSEEGGGGGRGSHLNPRPIEDKRAELAALAGLRANPEAHLSDDEVAALRAKGDNAGCMALKGANPAFEGEPQPDRWPLTGELAELAERWRIEPERDLKMAAAGSLARRAADDRLLANHDAAMGRIMADPEQAAFYRSELSAWDSTLQDGLKDPRHPMAAGPSQALSTLSQSPLHVRRPPMPKLSHFYGITIWMYWDEPHHHTPHFHALYGEDEASLDLQGEVIAGHLPRRQLRLVQAWVELHAEELNADWELATGGKPLNPIAPLR